ncbi:MAG: lysophospholipid acyltransferase family protein [Candidatus Hydrogenedentes bacterium]|nr:lysophospholipid acyltransferase family protein [Candidatus Hydrogenedentota bacterium]
MASKHNKITQNLTYFSILLFFKIFSFLPLSISRKLATVFASIAYHTVPRIKKIGMANLDIAYGDELDYAEKEQILRGSVKNLATVAVEFPKMPTLANKEGATHVTIKGKENIPTSTGSVFIGSHFSNWELVMPLGSYLGLHIIIIVRQFDDRRMDALVDGIRRASGVKTVPKDAAMKPLLSKLREGWHTGILADQNPRKNAVPVTFFGAPTWATIGPALIAMRTETPMIPVFMTRSKDGSYTMEISPAIPLENSGDTHTDLQTNTQRCQDALEAIIRKHPEQWLWFHRRWKKRDQLEQEWAERLAQRKADATPDTSGTREQE